MEDQDRRLLEAAAGIVTAYVANNAVQRTDLVALIETVHAALQAGAGGGKAEPEPLVPAVPIRKSITPDYLISLEDGRKLKLLKGYLRKVHGLTPAEYRRKWGLPADYPMTAPNYAAARSALAKKAGLGRKAAAAPEPTPAAPATGRKPRAGKKRG